MTLTISSQAQCSASSRGTPSTLRTPRPVVVARHTAPQPHAQRPLPTELAAAHNPKTQAPQDVRILFVCPPFFDFLFAVGGATSPTGSPSISRTSRFDAIASVFPFDLAAQKCCETTGLMVLQGCRGRVNAGRQVRGCARPSR